LEKEIKSFALAGNQTTISRFSISLDIYGTDYDILAVGANYLTKLHELET